ncbi:glutamate receptor 2.9 isoform X1 [Jatropha curcas]|uniref:glutamate receptor 2.9 isoform X1 n=1 Tax=Jatropha curcas TaxID=180498 RepID=UPI0005FBBB87|nr:glutamate receptor 2.9 isoform X1 [Jatropha curcas]
MRICFTLKALSKSDSKPWLLFLLLMAFSFIFLPCGAKPITGNYKQVINIGAIIDVDSRIGREEKTAMEIAVLDYNSGSKHYNLSLHFLDHQNHPLQAAQAAENLIKEKEVKAIVGMERWEEAAVVSDIGSQAQIPILSFAAPAITPPLIMKRWPFLVRMADNNSEQMKCIAELTRAYNWRRVIAVYEDNTYSNGDSGELSLLSQALQEVGSEVEHQLVLPPFAVLSDPKEFVKEELKKLEEVKSRVFIVLYSSLPMIINLFREAKEIGLVGEDTVWILTDSVTNFLDSVDTSVIHSMEGALGIKIHYSDNSSAYKIFYNKFRRNFMFKNPEEDSFQPGFYALKAYDSIATIMKALERMSSNETRSPKTFLNNILLSNFNGLSGQICFEAGELKRSSKIRIVNVVGKRYKDIDFWSPAFGFSRNENPNDRGAAMGIEGVVNWPGDLKRTPKGWAMPSTEKPLIIGVPGRTSFDRFVKVMNASEDRYEYDGFCIRLFYKVVDVLGYNLSFRFEPYNGTYDDLVNHVYNKTYDAIVGDVTILANRSDKVEFTQPYAESGLSMIVPVKSEESSWIFMKPFTWQMWVVTGAILIYTMFIVWFLEHQKNPEFRGPLKNQIGTAVWFTFSSLFFAHREKIYSNLTRVVIAVWLFVVLILNSSYTASFTSMLTIQRLRPNVTDIDLLIRNHLPIGCDGDSFVRNYLENVLKFRPENIKTISSEYNYTGEFQSRNIYAAFLELPYQKVFLSDYCKQYLATKPKYRFGGLGFVFQKGSPITADVSKAILQLSENGQLRDLESEWISRPSECSSDAADSETESLSVENFWGLYVISGATSTFCFLLCLIHLLNKYCHYQKEEQGNASPSDGSVWNKTVSLARYIYHGEIDIPGKSPTFSPSPDVHEWISPRRESDINSAIPDSPSAFSPAETGLVNIPDSSIEYSGANDNQPRLVLQL